MHIYASPLSHKSKACAPYIKTLSPSIKYLYDPNKVLFSSSKSQAQKYTLCYCNKLKYDFGADIS